MVFSLQVQGLNIGSTHPEKVFACQKAFAYSQSPYALYFCTQPLASTKYMGVDLTLKGERHTDLVRGLVEVLGIEGGAETKCAAGAELDVVGERSDTTVVDLGLFPRVSVWKRGALAG
jgi:hypothetical protein